jgi:hypothetical protein
MQRPAEDRKMHDASLGLAGLLAAGIILIGLQYVLAPRAATRSFGLPLPEEGPNVAWWLRLKGVRDITSGLVVFAAMLCGGSKMVGLLMLVMAIIPLGDMINILAARGSTRRAFGVHGLTFVLMLLAGAPLELAQP